jgi:hypothetical protein
MPNSAKVSTPISVSSLRTRLNSHFNKLTEEIKTFFVLPSNFVTMAFLQFKDCISITASCSLQLSVLPGAGEQVVGGLDGSGHHPVYSTESMLDSEVDASHIMVAAFSLHEIYVDDLCQTVVFKDPHPCCSDADWPFILLTGKEDEHSS